MQLARIIGILIVFGVPGIMLGGLVFHWFHSWFAVWVFEIILVITAAKTAYNAAGKSAPGGR